ncbi:TetR/AcrR family transcriptional regulator [Solihabitans fulvus]|uniref:TetR/AcrR family transcriptional regulator n=1 Tax=Solihabitans fulvus TaxID=1892852 RepID=A0A5B2XRT5_9PSEU|nr:TetR/AcrR family transcriptional regulator [Solihabitans fulvus]
MLRAAVELLEEVGYGRVTIEGVAARSGVAKSTIYRWWKSKATLVMEAYGHTVAKRVPEPDTGSLAGDLAAFLTELYRVADYPTRAKALRGLMAEAQLDPGFEGAFRDWAQGRRAVLAKLFGRAADRGELAPGLDVEYATDLVFGPFWYRLLVRHAPLAPAEAEAHATRLLAGLGGATL